MLLNAEELKIKKTCIKMVKYLKYLPEDLLFSACSSHSLKYGANFFVLL